MKKFLAIVLFIILFVLILVLSFKFGYNIVQKNLNIQETEQVNNKLSTNEQNSLKKEEIEKIDYNEAEKLLNECYKNASNCYRFSGYNISEKEEIIRYRGYDNTESDIYVYEIYDFQEVIKKYFSEDNINNVEKNIPLLIVQNNKYYFQLGGIAEEYDNLRFKDIQIENDKIIATAIIDIFAGEEKIKNDVESKFIIIKSGDKWLVDKYSDVTSF